LAKLEAQLATLSSSSYLDNSDGTVTDSRTGLIWLKNANCFNELAWDKAIEIVAKLAEGQCGLRDGSKRGMWRLPTKNEWEAMIDEKYIDRQNWNKPALSNTAGTGPWKEGDAFSGVQANYYWSFTTDVDDTNNAWNISLNNGHTHRFSKESKLLVWPVRDRK
jgi:hypothetical protein